MSVFGLVQHRPSPVPWGTTHHKKAPPTYLEQASALKARAEAATTVTLSPLQLMLLIAVLVGGTAMLMQKDKPSSRRAVLKQTEDDAREAIAEARRAYEVSR